MKVSRLFPLFGIAVFLYIIMQVDLGKVLGTLAGMDPMFFVLAVATVPPTVLIRAYKWRVLVQGYGIRYPFWDSVRAFLKGFSLSMVTPARVGDVSRAHYLKRGGGISTGKALTTVVIDRIIDILTLFCLGITGILYFAMSYAGLINIAVIFVSLFLLFILAVFVMSRKGIVLLFLRPLFSRMVPERYKDRFSLTFEEFYKGLEKARKRKGLIVYAVLLGFLNYVISIVQYYLMVAGMGIDVTFLFLFSLFPAVSLLDALPISFSGIGTRDAALIMFFSLVSIGKEAAVSLSLMVLFLGYMLIGLAGAALIVSDRGHRDERG